jgi:hypothetical protein
MRGVVLGCLVAAFGVSPVLAATDVTFTGTVSNTCTVAVPTPGLMALSADGKTLGSEQTGGLAASVTIVSLGGNSITVGAPSLQTYPLAYTPGSETVQVKYAGLSGLSSVSQTYTSSQTSFAVGILPLTTLLVNMQIINNAGFAQGTYTAKTVLTCS